MPIKASPDALVDFGACVLQATGVPAADARLLADSLVAAELWGHSSHGMLRLPWYVERLRQGAMQPVTHATMAVDHGAVVVLDGHDGIGQVLTQQAVALTYSQEAYADHSTYLIPVVVEQPTDRDAAQRNLAKIARKLQTHNGWAGSGSTYGFSLHEEDDGCFVIMSVRASISD